MNGFAKPALQGREMDRSLNVLIAGGGTGGHLMPALAIAAELQRVRPDAEPVLVGAHRGIEATVLPRYPFRFHLLHAEPIYRRQWWRNFRWPFIAWRVRREVAAVFARETPVLVIGTGGYASGPVVWRAQHRSIPTVLQEQNALPGVTTRWLARRARQIYLGFPEARELLSPGPETEVLTLGNPIRPPDHGDRGAALREFGLPNRPTVLVFGGSQGALAINETVGEAVRDGLLDGINLIWGTGAAHAERFAPLARDGIVVRGFLDPIATAYRAADLVVCRSGAMTVAEVCAWGKPSVLVPLPTAAADHQTKNARALAQAGAAVLVAESDFTPQSFAATTRALLGDQSRLESLGRVARERGQPNATRDMVSRIVTLLPTPQALSQV
jgi:UDP-N-acetylglucosamine--N-acetylmuramyl-(pentapeptide) pyrophosphoryl-undecaprenol N-acetylglucosamine transferase